MDTIIKTQNLFFDFTDEETDKVLNVLKEHLYAE